MSRANEYRVEPPFAVDELRRRLAERWTLDASEEQPVRRIYLDTFDWRLHRAGWRLCLDGEGPAARLCLAAVDRSQAPWRVPCERRPVKAGDLPEGFVRQRLAPLMAMRALVAPVELRGHGCTLMLRDGEGKIRVRIHWQQADVVPETGARRPLLVTLAVEAVRGYGDDHRAVLALLDGFEGLAPAPADELDRALRLVGREAGDYDSRLAFRFEPDQPAHEAFRRIMTHLVEAMRRNEPGIIDDRDSEFLHDFRVAVRRTRSLLVQMKPILPAAEYDRFRQGFAWLGEITGPVRDLDVYLLGLDDYRRGLSPHLRGGIDRMEPYLRARKAEAHDRLVADLASPEFRRLLADWRRFLRSPHWPVPELCSVPLAGLVARRVRALRKRVLRKGSAIHGDTPAEYLHALRKDCKKYRYLLEMFGGLLGEPALGASLKSLKRLQELLGDFQDCEVQLQRLPELADDIHRRDPQNVPTLMALGGLVEEIDERMGVLRRRFEQRFERFKAADRDSGFAEQVKALAASVEGSERW